MIGVKFTDLTDEQQSIIEKYGIEVVLPSDDVKKDIKSATIDTSFLGERPLSVEWINMPILKFKDGKEAQAEEDGYSFKVEVVDGTGEVVDNGAKGNSSNPSNWPSYYEKAKKACNIIMNYCQNKNAFGSKESPSYENTDIWAILQQLDAAIFHMEIQIILTNGLQIPKSICSYLKIRELMFLNGRQQNFQN